MNELIIQKIKERRKKKTPLQLRYDFNIKKNNSKEKLIINTSTLIMKTKYGNFFKNKKNLTVDNDYISKSRIIKKNLKKYNTTPIKFEKKIINGLIFDGKSHLISIFKDLLFWNDDVECFKRLYNKKECVNKIKKFEEFYRVNYNSLKIFPIFFHLGECNKVFFKYYQLKYKLQKEIIKEKKRKKNKLLDYINDKKKEKYSLIIKIQSQSHNKLTSLSLNLSKENLNDIHKNENVNDIDNEAYNIIDDNLSSKNLIFNNQTRNDNKNNLSFSFDNDTVKSILKNLTKTIFPKENSNTIINNNINNQYHNNYNYLINTNNYIIKKYFNNKNYYNRNNTFKKKDVDIQKKTFNESEKNTTNSNQIKKKRNNQKISFKLLSSTNSFYKLPMLINNKKKERNESKKYKLSLPKKNAFCFTERGNLFKEKKTIKIINTIDNNRNKFKFRTTNISPSKFNRNFFMNQNKKGK